MNEKDSFIGFNTKSKWQRRDHIYVEARQWNGLWTGNTYNSGIPGLDIAAWVKSHGGRWEHQNVPTPEFRIKPLPSSPYWLAAWPGNWILYCADGHFDVMGDADFTRTYERIPTAEPEPERPPVDYSEYELPVVPGVYQSEKFPASQGFLPYVLDEFGWYCDAKRMTPQQMSNVLPLTRLVPETSIHENDELIEGVLRLVKLIKDNTK